MNNDEQAFIGPRPETATPVWVTPFRAEGSQIRDANNNHVGGISGDKTSPEEDESLTELIVTLINRYATPFEEDPTPEPKTEFVGRVLVRVGEMIDTDAIENGYAFAYEMAPGQFWFSESREQALIETRDAGPNGKGWYLPRRRDTTSFTNQYVDVATGMVVNRED